MSLRDLPQIKAFERPKAYSWDLPSDLLSEWDSDAFLAADNERSGGNQINIYEPIGADIFGDGFTSKRMNAALRSISNKDVVVRLNSPGGDVFEGVAIYNELIKHNGKVTVEIMGIAASAASFIAMAGDQIEIGVGAKIMIHNSWGVVIGDRRDMVSAANLLGQIDDAMIDIYAARTGLSGTELRDMMDAETFLSHDQAIEKKFADKVFERDQATKTRARAHVPANIQAKRRVENILAQSGVPRSERRNMIAVIESGVCDAAVASVCDAAFNRDAAERLIQTISRK